jgi:hypothetical protein
VAGPELATTTFWTETFCVSVAWGVFCSECIVLDHTIRTICPKKAELLG